MHTVGFLKPGLALRHIHSDRSATAVLLPGFIYVSPSAAAARAYWEQVGLSRPVAPGFKRALAVFPCGLPLLLPLTESLGSWSSRTSLGLLNLKKKKKERGSCIIDKHEKDASRGAFH